MTTFRLKDQSLEALDRELARINFEAYNKAKGGVTWDGKKTPPWEQLGDDVRNGWLAGAIAVRLCLEAFNKEAFRLTVERLSKEKAEGR